LKPYLKKFGECFFNRIKTLIDEAMIEENKKMKLIYEVFNSIFNENDLMNLNANDKSEFLDFKDMLTELLAQANEYNLINSKFFGRDSLMAKVTFLLFHLKSILK
jgi:galactose-1-phosphate uridylyltransferase